MARIAPHACAPFFLLAGIQHILFVQFVETLVPPFIPFARFWTYFAAGALLAAGFGLLAPPVRRLAAILTGWMVLSWVFLVHVPLIVRIGPLEWQGVFEALGISGVCFLLADTDRLSLGWSDPCQAMSAPDRRLRRRGPERPSPSATSASIRPTPR